MAAGVRIAVNGLEAFAEAIAAELAPAFAARPAERRLAIDAMLSAGGARPELVAELERAGPFGSAAPEPLFAFPAHVLADAHVVGAGHVRARLKAGDGTSLNAIAFRAADGPLGQALLAARGERVHAAGSLAIDRWGGGERVQLRLVDIARA